MICICGVCISLETLIPLLIVLFMRFFGFKQPEKKVKVDGADGGDCDCCDAEITPGAVNSIKSHGQFKKVLNDNSDKAIVVDFTASWCGPCQRIKPLYEEMAKELKESIFLVVDVDENEETAAECSISAMPTFIVFKNGKEVDKIRGANETALKSMINKHK